MEVNYYHQHHQQSPASSSEAVQFCQPGMSGGGMTMYMDGFSSTLFNPSAPCLNLYISNFTLDSTFKFGLAMLIVICIGMLVEGVAWLKRRYISGMQKKRRGRIVGGGDEFVMVKFILAGFQGLQALIGYVLMLAMMSYSIELFLSAIVGFILGVLIFSKQHRIIVGGSSGGTDIVGSNNNNSDSPLLDAISYESNEMMSSGIGTPCCGLDSSTIPNDDDGTEPTSLLLRRTNNNTGTV